MNSLRRILSSMWPCSREQPPDRRIIIHALFWLYDTSVCGRRYKAQGSEAAFMHAAVCMIGAAVKTGRLKLWGVRSGGCGFVEVSPDQASAGLRIEPDNAQLWHVSLHPDNTGFDWLAVDMNEIRRLWP